MNCSYEFIYFIVHRLAPGYVKGKKGKGATAMDRLDDSLNNEMMHRERSNESTPIKNSKRGLHNGINGRHPESEHATIPNGYDASSADDTFESISHMRQGARDFVDGLYAR